MNTKLFELKPCEECKGTAEAYHLGHNFDCPDCLGTGYEEPQRRIMNLELMLNQHKEALKSSDAHNNDLAQKFEMAQEQIDHILLRLGRTQEKMFDAERQRDRLAEALREMRSSGDIVICSQSATNLTTNTQTQPNLIHNGVGIADMYSRDEFENAMKRTN